MKTPILTIENEERTPRNAAEEGGVDLGKRKRGSEVKSPRKKPRRGDRPEEMEKEWKRWEKRKERMEKRGKKKEKEEELEKEERELWKEVKEELDEELRLERKVSKETYFVVGKMLEKYKKGKKELSQHQIKAAKRIYTMYKDLEFDDGVGIGEVVHSQKLDLSKLARKKWVSKILGGRSCYGKPI